MGPLPFQFDLTVPEHAYLFGFLQSDGHMSQETRNRGKVRVEINADDAPILKEFQRIIQAPSSLRFRERDTNFKDGHRSAVWSMCDQDLRATFHDLGLPYGRKSKTVAPPSTTFSKPDYFRGLLDGDGSLGLTGEGFPFLAWCTSSRVMAEAIEVFLFGITGKRKDVNPNTRDGSYNVAVWKEDAQAVARLLYYEGCLALPRKASSAQGVVAWVRPETMRRVTWERRRWTPEDDEVVLTMDTDEAVQLLGRTATSVRTRRWRLTQGDAR